MTKRLAAQPDSAGESYSLTVVGVHVRIHSTNEFGASKPQQAMPLGPERTAALPGAAAGRARRGPVRIHAHRPAGSVRAHGGRLRLAYQPGNLTVGEGLGCLGEGPARQPLPAAAAEEYRAALGIPDRA